MEKRDAERIEGKRETRKLYLRIETDRAKGMVQQEEGSHALEQ